ncbi:MAG: hypothetical protein SF028_03185 [Candidatus Sumerlaeia bacterium]|nr:hypothetical protein [Candidatus Sumerlaeia bacterium]
MRRLLMAGALALLAAASPAQLPLETPEQSLDRLTARSLRAAIDGDAEAARRTALEVVASESIFRDRGFDVRRVSGSAAALASVMRAPTLRQLDADLEDFPRTETVRVLRRQLRTVEPRQRFLEAQGDRRYERFRRIYNGVVTPLANVLAGQFLDLLALPLEGAEALVVGQPYATPEERRELHRAREALTRMESGDRVAARAEQAVERLEERRARLARLQARHNAALALEADDPRAAAWWYEREQLLAGEAEPFRGAHREVLADLRGAAAARELSLEVADGERALAEPLLQEEVGSLLRTVLADPTAPDLVIQTRSLDRNEPGSGLSETFAAVEAMVAMRNGQDAYARAQLESIAGRPGLWGRAAESLRDRTSFYPAEAVDRARAASRAGFWSFIRTGNVPIQDPGAALPEEARLDRRRWVDGVRSFFVLDMVSRLLLSPLLPPPPAQELADAINEAPAWWLETDEGRRAQRRAAGTLAERRRFDDAKALYLAAGEPVAAVRMDRRAARALERRAEDAPTPQRRAELYRRLLAAHPDYVRRDRAEAALARAEIDADAVLAVPRDLLLADPAYAFERGLNIPRELLDGSKANGEIDRDGVRILRGGGMSYRDRGTGVLMELPLAPEQAAYGVALAAPALRAAQVGEEARKPLPRRRIPLAVEGGAVPGFDFGPGLVPLKPDPELRRLYE